MKASELGFVKASKCYKCGKDFEPDDEIVLVSGFRDFVRALHTSCYKGEK